MVHQIRPWLYIGRYRDTTNEETARALGIGAMLQLAEAVEHADIATLFLPVHDGEYLPIPLLEQGVAFVRAQKAQGCHVMIACSAGISRSVTFTIAVLHEEEGLSLPAAFRSIHVSHKEARPHFALWNSICQYYGERLKYVDLMDDTLDF
jgi:protein-tyrosine phosphatase